MASTSFTDKFENYTLYIRNWHHDTPKGVIILVHGLGEHCQRYNHLAHAFNQTGYAVIGFDHIGHGKSTGKRGHIPGIDKACQSVNSIIKKTELIYEDVPLYMFGHSMGGNIALNYLLREDNHSIVSAVISAPWLELPFTPPPLLVGLGKIIKNIYPSFQNSTNLDVSAISRIDQEVQKYVRDPLVHDKISAQWFVEGRQAGKWAIKHANQLTIPTLIIHGDADKLTSFYGSKKFTQNAGPHVHLKKIKGGYHELINDVDKDQHIQTIIDWIDEN